MKNNEKNTEVERLLQTLMEIPSSSGDEGGVLRFLEELLNKEGFVIQRIPVSKQTFCLFATVGQPNLIFQAHTDTVSPFISFSQDDEFIYGRGSCDTKGSIAAMVVAATTAKKQGQTNFGVLFTVEEETTFRGALAAAEIFQNPRPYFVVGEPSSLQPVTCQFGIDTVIVSSEGKAAHTSTPEKGVNAIDGLMRNAYQKLAHLPLGEGTLGAVVQISGGTAPNILPAQAELVFGLRVAPGDKTDYLKVIQKLVFPCRVERGEFVTSVKCDLPESLSFLGEGLTVRYCTELAFFQRGCILGPGDIRFAHSPDERVPKKELAQAVELYRQIIERWEN
jgi:acetylornithine deacetylase